MYLGVEVRDGGHYAGLLVRGNVIILRPSLIPLSQVYDDVRPAAIGSISQTMLSEIKSIYLSNIIYLSISTVTARWAFLLYMWASRHCREMTDHGEEVRTVAHHHAFVGRPYHIPACTRQAVHNTHTHTHSISISSNMSNGSRTASATARRSQEFPIVATDVHASCTATLMRRRLQRRGDGTPLGEGRRGEATVRLDRDGGRRTEVMGGSGVVCMLRNTTRAEQRTWQEKNTTRGGL